MSDNGYNPLGWDCSTSGCFNVKKRPKIEQFHDCLPGRISFGDVDGIVEINGYVLMLEFKPAPDTLQMGQKIMYERLSTSPQFSVLCLAGDAETMEITHGLVYDHAHRTPKWRPCSISQARKFVQQWSTSKSSGPAWDWTLGASRAS